MRRLPPLNGLRAFEAAARHLSFQAAAQELGVTPTAISHQIRGLEVYCGQTLFRRRPRPVALTPAGARLFPTLRDGFDRFEAGLSAIRPQEPGGRLRMTTTNAFAARWLVPRLASWRQCHPGLRLDLASTDAVLDLAGGEVDVAIRYCRTAPTDGVAAELVRDRFVMVGAPALVGDARSPIAAADLARFPLLDCTWLPGDTLAPTWQTWVQAARDRGRTIADLGGLAAMHFREESHMIDAVLAGQGIALCSDLLVAAALRDGSLRVLSDVSLAGYGLYFVHRRGHRQEREILALLAWMTDQFRTSVP